MKLQGLEAEAVWDTMPTGRLLVVDDDSFLRATLMEQFAAEGFDEVYEAETLIETFREIDLRDPDLIILDIRLPDGNGIEICCTLRERGFAKPIIMLTAKGDEEDIIKGLKLGADDYIPKPFSVRELLARVESVLRRSHKLTMDQSIVTWGPFAIDPINLTLKTDEGEQELTRREVEILKYLIEFHDRPVSRFELLKEVWGYQNPSMDTRTVDIHMTKIRKKLESDPQNPKWIQTIRGEGYKIEKP